ncbi:coatomer subunit beta-like isoform X2 [Halichondria panicea]|uniref:coatomer subunit beta-like isoform X2 n=1 Tax=Halichondria panicea TaxID=6063 RepID=UPI00312BB579
MSSVSELACYTLIHNPAETEAPNEQQLKHDLEHGDARVKANALKKLIQLVLNGERLPGLLMTIIRFVLPSSDHQIKKLLLIFWEIWPKTSPDGKLLHEMILVCDAYRKDLQHPNEFIRGSTLRFLCKLKESELLEPLMPSIRGCLDHRHAYVRRNAVMAIYTIYRNFEALIPDAPELIHNYLEGELDASCKRNAFMMLIHADRECYANPSERARFIRCIYNLLNSSSPSVRYEAAGTLVTLSSTQAAVKAASQAYIELIVRESDNNVKLIVLDRLTALKGTPAHEKVLQELVMDILRVLGSPDLEVRKKTLSLVLELVNSRNVDEVVLVLKKEVASTSTGGTATEGGDRAGYRQALVKTLHTTSIKFPAVASTVVPLLLEFLSDSDESTAEGVLVFVREAVQTYPQLKTHVVAKLLEVFSQIKFLNIHRATLWILGEYCTSVEDISRVLTVVRATLGEIPLVDSELRKAANSDESDSGSSDPSESVRTLVTAHGTYATQSAFTAAPVSNKEKIPPLRSYLLDGDFFIASSLASTLTKLCVRYLALMTDQQSKNAFCAESMLIIASILHLGKSGIPKKAISQDDVERLSVCLRVLCERCEVVGGVFGEKSRQVLADMISLNQQSTASSSKSEPSAVSVQADELIHFVVLAGQRDEVKENVYDASLLSATGPIGGKEGKSNQLSKVVQLTGFSDPVYAEAYVNVNQYDIVLDVLVVNQTGDTLQGLQLELATLGDLKLVEKPMPCTVGPHDFVNIKASIKVSSTENGIIFGNIVYDIVGSTADRNCVVLNNIHIDIMDYIQPESCTDAEFRKMWAEFEWENKIAVATNIGDLEAYLEHILQSTNMNCLTPKQALSGECGFLAANLYARSIFGEDALANVSVEKPPGSNQSVTGHIRIRAKTQGMALSLGDKINLSQKTTGN